MEQSSEAGMDWDDAYSNAAHIPGGAEFPARWAERAAAYRAGTQGAELDLAYGAHPRQRMDLFHPEGAPRGLAVFVHGGYWMAFDKSSWSHLAEGARRRGWVVAVPSYVLAPEAGSRAITVEVARAVAFAAARVGGGVRLAGHSAGGHLVSRMLCADGPLGDGRGGARRAGGLDQRPARPAAAAEYPDERDPGPDRGGGAGGEPGALAPRPGARITAWVGAAERPEFLRQSRLSGRGVGSRRGRCGAGRRAGQAPFRRDRRPGRSRERVGARVRGVAHAGRRPRHPRRGHRRVARGDRRGDGRTATASRAGAAARCGCQRRGARLTARPDPVRLRPGQAAASPFSFARSIEAIRMRCASALSPQPATLAHLPSSSAL